MTSATRASSKRQMGGFTAAELEMFAEDEMVEIVPHFSFQEVHFLSGTYGPFQAKMPTEVPFWLALQLKHRQLCTIRLPHWLEESELAALKDNEDQTREQNTLSKVDFHYQEKAALFFRHSADSFAGQEGNPRVVVKDLEELREAKLRTSLRDLDTFQSVIQIDNASGIEINRIRHFVVGSLEEYQKISKASEALLHGDEDSSQFDDSQPGASL